MNLFLAILIAETFTFPVLAVLAAAWLPQDAHIRDLDRERTARKILRAAVFVFFLIPLTALLTVGAIAALHYATLHGWIAPAVLNALLRG